MPSSRQPTTSAHYPTDLETPCFKQEAGFQEFRDYVQNADYLFDSVEEDTSRVSEPTSTASGDVKKIPISKVKMVKKKKKGGLEGAASPVQRTKKDENWLDIPD